MSGECGGFPGSAWTRSFLVVLELALPSFSPPDNLNWLYFRSPAMERGKARFKKKTPVPATHGLSFSKSSTDNLVKTNELLNQEVERLRAQVCTSFYSAGIFLGVNYYIARNLEYLYMLCRLTAWEIAVTIMNLSCISQPRKYRWPWHWLQRSLQNPKLQRKV